MSDELLLRYVQLGVMTIDEARLAYGLGRGNPLRRQYEITPRYARECSYCKAKAGAGRCRGCGAPA